MRVACGIALRDDERKALEKWARGRSTPARLVQRAQVVLLAAGGLRNKEIGPKVGTDQQTVTRWRTRFARQRLAGLEKDAPRAGRPPAQRDAMGRKIIEMTTRQKPKNSTHWSTRSLARHLGVSHMMVQRVWKANGLKPHRVRTFKVSNDPHFAEKLVDVVGLYLSPPEHALVLSVDEKSQIQALDRTQPSLPMYPGRCGTLTHDYARHGTTTLFAAMEMAEGKLIAACMNRHRHQEWIRFLNLIDRQTPLLLEIHLIVDNYATHKHPSVQRWLKRHRRFHFHFIPTSSSWLNLIERWFRELTEKRLRRGAFKSLDSLQKAILDFIAQHNENPKTFVWRAKVDRILDKVRRARQVLDNQSSG